MSRRRHVVMMLLPLLAMPVPLSADAQTAMPASALTLDPAARREIIEAFAREMRERYVFPKQGERVAEQVTTALAAGKVAPGVSSPVLRGLAAASAGMACPSKKPM